MSERKDVSEIEVSANVDAAAPPMTPHNQGAPSLSTDQTGKFNLDSLDSQLGFARSIMKQGLISSTFTTPQQVVIGIQWAIAMRMNVMTALRMMYVVNGRPCLWGDGPLSLVQQSGKVEGFEEFWIDEKGKRICFQNKNLRERPWASVCRIKRRGDSEWQEDFFSLIDLEKSGLSKKKNGGKKETWDKFERLMMRYKARAMALKSKFADIINGMEIAEYHHHQSPAIGAVSDKDAKSNIASEFLRDIV